MVSRSLADNKQLVQTTPERRVWSNNSWDDGKISEQHAETSHNLTGIEFTVTPTRNTKDALHNSEPEILDPDHTLRPTSSSAGSRSNLHFDSYLKSPLILSPIETASSVASSPGTESDIWDSPQTPSRRSIQKSQSSVLTPLTPSTPPSTHDDSKKQYFGSKRPESPLSRVVKSETTSDKAAILVARSDDDEDEPEDTVRSDGDPVSRRLFQNLKKEDLFSAKVGAAADITLHYNRNPTSFNFGESTSFITSKSTNVKKTHDLESTTTTPQIKLEDNEIQTKPKIIREPQKLPKDFQENLKFTIPEEFRARLRNNPNRCVATYVKRSPQRCDETMEEKSHSVDETLEAISTCYEQRSYTILFGHIEKLSQAVTCRIHRNVARRKLEKLRKTTSNFSQVSDEMDSAIQAWARAIVNNDSLPSAQEATDHDAKVDKKPATSKCSTVQAESAPPPTVKTDDAVEAMTPEFIPYQPKWTKILSIAEALLSLIIKPIPKEGAKEGFIYIFSSEQDPGMLKIGHTIDLKRRLQTWDSDCKRKHSYQEEDEPINVPYAGRIEKIIHIELKDYRRQRNCGPCVRLHEEWFDVSKAHAIKVCQKWRMWSLQKPYVLDSISGKWVLRPEMLDILLETCLNFPFVSTPCLPHHNLKT